MSLKQLNFVLIGPGIMPIPPAGWGAVEILIWDYAKALEGLGHNVTILNDKNLENVVNTIKIIKPDIVHIQYDEHAHLAGTISPYTKVVGITSHYGYFEQPEKWGSYRDVFYSIIRQNQPNTYHFVLSEAIANIYRQAGLPNEKIIVVPNGANHNQFKYTDEPRLFDRSIYLAKLDYRKRQYLFQNIPDLYFAGNPADNRFNTASPRYLGEWSKEYLYENLTHYGNLVLLSDGEADPLVVKEALVCGLGVVISQWSTAGLDLTKPYITVIPENKITDIAFVESEIRRNRELSTEYRKEIREYGLTFTWSRLVGEYVKNIQTILFG
jgi:glycosyltransferase involved in cell wall biosynthesis